MTSSSSVDDVSILKTLWGRDPDGGWGMRGAKGLTLKPRAGFDASFFKFESRLELLTQTPGPNELFSAFGPTDFLLKQSILPVVAWNDGDTVLRCIGTASVISCSGYVMTASHVLLDPKESGYGDVSRNGNTLTFGKSLNVGVFIPTNPASNVDGLIFFRFEQSWFWGGWKSSPLIHEDDRFEYLTDVAICKIAPMPSGSPHQPLNLSLHNFRPGEKAYAYGYALMNDIPINATGGISREHRPDLYVSVGHVMRVFPKNHLQKEVPTPGPCFDFNARIPGKMSGGPILGADGAVVRGIVSRSYSQESHAYGGMLAPVMRLPLGSGHSFQTMMELGNEGIARISGPGL